MKLSRDGMGCRMSYWTVRGRTEGTGDRRLENVVGIQGAALQDRRVLLVLGIFERGFLQ